jgi:predicted nuclease of predicted toxin-antitoxin system
VRFFVDNNLPPALAKALHALSEPDGYEALHLKQKFDQDTADSDWIDTLSKEGGWSVITHDKLNKGLEREALRRAGLIVFFLDKGWSSHTF